MRCIFLQVDQAFTASVESKVTPLTIAVFLKFSSGNSVYSAIFISHKVRVRSQCTLYYNLVML